MAKKKKAKKKASKKAKKKAKKTKISVNAVKAAIRDAEDALNIANRNLQQLKKKFAPIKTLKQTRCNLEV